MHIVVITNGDGKELFCGEMQHAPNIGETFTRQVSGIKKTWLVHEKETLMVIEEGQPDRIYTNILVL